jgi:uncharacterized protein (DUF58 family)
MSTISFPIRLPRSLRVPGGDVRSAAGRLVASARHQIICALTRDLCPRAAPVERFVRRPIVLLAVMLAIAILLAAYANPVSSTAAFALGAVIVVGYGWPALVIRGITADLRPTARRGVEGEVLPVVLTVRNAWPIPVWGIAIEADVGGHERVSLAHLRARATDEFRWECVPGCRGEFPRGRVELVTGFPFGITFARRAVRVDRTAVVWPATVPLDAALDVGEAAATEEAVCDRRVGDAGDVIGTRPFRQGDPLRRVHWPLTARTGSLVTCERQAPLATSVRVIVDCNPASHDGGGPTGSLEDAIRVAASICRSYHRGGARVECRLGRERLDVPPGGSGLTRFLDSLARMRIAGDAAAGSPLEGGAAVRKARPAGGGLVIEITTARGLAATPARRGPACGLLIVIDPVSASADLPLRSLPAGRVVRLVSGGDTLSELARCWGGIRHAG